MCCCQFVICDRSCPASRRAFACFSFGREHASRCEPCGSAAGQKDSGPPSREITKIIQELGRIPAFQTVGEFLKRRGDLPNPGLEPIRRISCPIIQFGGSGTKRSRDALQLPGNSALALISLAKKPI